MTESEPSNHSLEETVHIRTETLRRMLSTPPQHHATAPPQTPRSRKKADVADAPPAPAKGNKKA
jgi:hypothetical protein